MGAAHSTGRLPLLHRAWVHLQQDGYPRAIRALPGCLAHLQAATREGAALLLLGHVYISPGASAVSGTDEPSQVT